MKIFISYSHKDESDAKKLYDNLIERGYSPWFDKESLLPGQEWESEIKKAIVESHFVILLLSSNSVERRGYFQKEIRIAIEVWKTVPAGHVFLIPARLGECDIPESLRAIQWVNMKPDWDKGVDKICEITNYEKLEEILSRPIDEQAPVPNDIRLSQPDSDLPSELVSMLGYWHGRWGEVLPSQLVVEEITLNSAIVVYSWGDHPSGSFTKGWTRNRATSLSPGRISFGDAKVSKFTFEFDTDSDIIHGTRESPQDVSKIVMQRNRF